MDDKTKKLLEAAALRIETTTAMVDVMLTALTKISFIEKDADQMRLLANNAINESAKLIPQEDAA